MRKVKSSLWPICGTPPVWDCSGYRRSDRCASRSPSRSGAGPKTTSRGYNSPSAPDSEEPFEAANMKLQTILLGDLADDAVRLLHHLGELLVAALVQILAELALPALEIAVHVAEFQRRQREFRED